MTKLPFENKVWFKVAFNIWLFINYYESDCYIKGSNPFSSASFKGWTQVCPFLFSPSPKNNFTTHNG